VSYDALRMILVMDLSGVSPSQKHCSCKQPYKHHGKCMECVVMHRAHRGHLPYCFHSMVNERLEKLSELTEHSFV